MSITWTKVAAIPFTGSGCGLQGVTCLGNNRMLATLEEDLNAAETGPVVRNFLSDDNGLTWEEIDPLDSLSAVSFSRVRVLSRDTVLMGNDSLGGGPGTYEADQSVIARSTDGGATWASAIPAGAFAGIVGSPPNWRIVDFAPVDATRVIAAGNGATHVPEWIFLISNDGGATFGEAQPIPSIGVTIFDATCVVSLGGGIVIAGLSAAQPRLLRSTNRGDTWSAITLPGPTGTFVVGSVVNLGGGAALAVGSAGKVWHSADFGASWSLVTTLPADAFAALAVSATQVVVGMDGINPVTSGTTPFRLSTDGGATFPDAGTMVSPTNGAYAVKQFAVADNGAVLAVCQTTAAPFDEIWRGVITGFGGPGPCSSIPVIIESGTDSDSGCEQVFRARSGVCIDELTDDDIIRGRWQAGDRLIINRVIFSIDWDHVTQQFTKHVIYTFADSVRKYGLRPAIRIESKGIRSTPTTCGAFGTIGCGLAMLDERAFNIGARYADPPAMLNLEIFYRKHTWEPGDIICVTSAFVPNISSGRRGITDEAFEIINIQQQFAPEGKIILTLLDVEAITLPDDPDRSVPQEEVELLVRERAAREQAVELPLRLGEGRTQRTEIATWRRGPPQEPEPVVPRPAPRREILDGGSRGIAPTVP